MSERINAPPKQYPVNNHTTFKKEKNESSTDPTPYTLIVKKPPSYMHNNEVIGRTPYDIIGEKPPSYMRDIEMQAFIQKKNRASNDPACLYFRVLGVSACIAILIYVLLVTIRSL